MVTARPVSPSVPEIDMSLLLILTVFSCSPSAVYCSPFTVIVGLPTPGRITTSALATIVQSFVNVYGLVTDAPSTVTLTPLNVSVCSVTPLPHRTPIYLAKVNLKSRANCVRFINTEIAQNANVTIDSECGGG